MAKASIPCAERIAAIGETIASYRIRGSDFCKRSGIAHATWCRWKRGVTIPRADALDRAERALAEMVKSIRSGQP